MMVLRRRAQPLEELARIAARRVREVSVDEPVFAVTHSMGAVVMRHMEVCVCVCARCHVHPCLITSPLPTSPLPGVDAPRAWGTCDRAQLLPPGERPRWCGACMLAPPSRGATLSRKLLSTPGVRWVYSRVCGPAAVQLGAPRHHIDARCVV